VTEPLAAEAASALQKCDTTAAQQVLAEDEAPHSHLDRDAETWRADFEERAAILEFELGLSREEADRQAFIYAVEKWLVSHPEPPREVWRGCAHCLDDDAEASPLITLPVRGGTTVLHAGCVTAWQAYRGADAESALMRMGIVPAATRTEPRSI
jgi:hypothetical protein